MPPRTPIPFGSPRGAGACFQPSLDLFETSGTEMIR